MASKTKKQLQDELTAALAELKALKAQACTPFAGWGLKRGTLLEVQMSYKGHAFVFLKDRSSYATCIGCGQPLHELFPDWWKDHKKS